MGCYGVEAAHKAISMLPHTALVAVGLMESEKSGPVRDGAVATREVLFMNRSWRNWLLYVFDLPYLAFLKGGAILWHYGNL